VQAKFARSLCAILCLGAFQFSQQAQQGIVVVAERKFFNGLKRLEVSDFTCALV